MLTFALRRAPRHLDGRLPRSGEPARTAAPRPRFWHCGLAALVVMAAACGTSDHFTSPSKDPLPLVTETANIRYHHAPGDSINIEWQEAYHEWATERLGVRVPRKIDYYKYRDRQDMGDHTGHYNTNGWADPGRFEVHTLYPTDNHEVVHVYTALIGRPSDFFNEGIAVAFQTDPPASRFESVFRGRDVHQTCAEYLRNGALVVPLDRMIVTGDFRGIRDEVLSYTEAGSFLRFVIDRFGLPSTLAFFRMSTRDDDRATIRARFQAAFGTSLDATEREWLELLSARGGTR